MNYHKKIKEKSKNKTLKHNYLNLGQISMITHDYSLVRFLVQINNFFKHN